MKLISIKRFYNKIFIIIFFIFSTILQSISQTNNNNVYLRLGMDINEIKQEITDYKIDYIDNTKVLIQDTEYIKIFYFFNINDICNLQAYLYNIDALSHILKSFKDDKNFIRMDALEYLYSDGQYVRKYLLYIDEDKGTLILYVEDV